jgi:hypothetical protein
VADFPAGEAGAVDEPVFDDFPADDFAAGFSDDFAAGDFAPEDFAAGDFAAPADSVAIEGGEDWDVAGPRRVVPVEERLDPVEPSPQATTATVKTIITTISTISERTCRRLRRAAAGTTRRCFLRTHMKNLERCTGAKPVRLRPPVGQDTPSSIGKAS